MTTPLIIGFGFIWLGLAIFFTTIQLQLFSLRRSLDNIVSLLSSQPLDFSTHATSSDDAYWKDMHDSIADLPPITWVSGDTSGGQTGDMGDIRTSAPTAEAAVIDTLNHTNRPAVKPYAEAAMDDYRKNDPVYKRSEAGFDDGVGNNPVDDCE